MDEDEFITMIFIFILLIVIFAAIYYGSMSDIRYCESTCNSRVADPNDYVSCLDKCMDICMACNTKK